MRSDNQPSQLTPEFSIPKWVWIASVISIAVGAAGMAVGFSVAPADTWLWLVIAFVTFAGLAHGMLAWAAAFRVAQARWTAVVNRLGHSVVVFLPFLFAVLALLLAGVRNYAPWATHPVAGKAAWLNVPFMTAREFIAVGALWALFSLLVRWSLQADADMRESGQVDRRSQFRLTAIGTACIMMYTVTGSIMAYDFTMSFSPEWVSTMFAPYFWITNMYAAMAALILMAALMRRALHVERFLDKQQFHDMGNLLLAFSLFSMGLFFAQYLTIWYENLPGEARFLIIRYHEGVWPWLGWSALIVGYVIPFILLQSRRLKRDPRMLSPVAVMALAGVAIERYVLVVPSLRPTQVMLYPVSGLCMLGFLGVLVLGIALFFQRYSPVSAADAELEKAQAEMEVET